MVKNAVGTVAHLPHGVDDLEMTIVGEVLHLAAGIQDEITLLMMLAVLPFWQNRLFKTCTVYQITKF